MNFNFLIVDKLSNVATNHRRPVVMWFCYHFFMVVLCCINILFFIINWTDLSLCINDVTNILLTIIGFLFAFAGINIYSIFNTNIEAEKERLIEIREKYSQIMDITLEEMTFSANTTKLQLYGQLIFTSKKNNSQLLEWIQNTTQIINEIEVTLEKYKTKGSLTHYLQRKNDLIAVSRSLGYLANNFLNEVSKTGTSYFNGLDNNNKEYIIKEIEKLKTRIEEFGECTEKENQSSAKHISTNRFLGIISKLINKFRIFAK